MMDDVFGAILFLLITAGGFYGFLKVCDYITYLKEKRKVQK